MERLPRDILRLLFGFLPPRVRFIFAQTNQRIRSCSTLEDRLTWSCGPPEGLLTRKLQEIAASISPGFEFEFANFCTTCERPKCDHHRDQCPYETEVRCQWCGLKCIWRWMPWETRVNRATFFARFDFQCKVCKGNLRWKQDHVRFNRTDRRFCLQCKNYQCDRCKCVKCEKCFQDVYLTSEQVIDEIHECKGTLLYRWMVFIKKSTSSTLCSFSACKRYIIVSCKKSDNSPKTTILSVWCLAEDGDISTIATVLDHHTKKQRKPEFPGSIPFLHFVYGEPDENMSLIDQHAKVFTLDEYVAALPD